MAKLHAIFDIELIGDNDPVLLVCVKIVELGRKAAFWWHKPGDMAKLRKLFDRDDITWVGFNSTRFDMPIMSALFCGFKPPQLKDLAERLVAKPEDGGLMPWVAEKTFGYDAIRVDHIDLFHTAPGVRVSLKRYMGRMGYKSMIDMPFHHTKDLTEDELPVVETYCYNDVGGTEELFHRLKTELSLRVAMSAEYDVDMRSKSDAQIAEAIFKTRLGIKKNNGVIPPYVEYRAPPLIKTDNPVILDLIDRLEGERFFVNRNNGRPQKAEWMRDDGEEEGGEAVQLGFGSYTLGLGGLHSCHDVKLHAVSTEQRLISDFDVTSYYPNVIMKVGLIPNFGGMKGEQFIDEYQVIYDRRVAAKYAGNKQVSNSLKIVLNGTFGKLGEKHSILYAPDLLIATTITGQLNLLCLIADLEKLPTVKVLSANTDGIMVDYPKHLRSAVLAVISRNAVHTGFEYEETPYRTVAMKDVNNYIAVTADRLAAVIKPDGTIDEEMAKGGKAKAKGLYASNDPAENPLYLMKNPTMGVCGKLARQYLVAGVLPEVGIRDYSDMKDYVAVREVKGGGVQHLDYEDVDDWVLIEDVGTVNNLWESRRLGKQARRKSRPKAKAVGVGGVPFGRVARWYMTREFLPPLTYEGSGNKVPKTDGAKVCMLLPDQIPPDLDRAWYIKETYSMLADMGVVVRCEEAAA